MAGDKGITMYNNYCASHAVRKEVNLVLHDFKTFDFNVFKLGEFGKLTVKCSVAIFPIEDIMPDNCTHIFDDFSSVKTVDISKDITIASATQTFINNFIFLVILFAPLY